MSNEKLVSFEYLLQAYKETQKSIVSSYRGISLTKKAKNILYLQFKTNDRTRKQYSTDLRLDQRGLVQIVEYARLVYEKLRNYESELEFDNWYNETIRGINNTNKTKVSDNGITFKQAIDNLYDWFMSHTDRRGYKRKDNLVSSNNSFDATYLGYLKNLPLDNLVNLDDCLAVVNRYYPEHPKSYRESITAVRKLLEINELYHLKDQWDKQRFHKTNNRNKKERVSKKQIITEDQIITLHNSVIENIDQLTKNGFKEVRLWLNAIMIGFIYGIRPIETFAIKNLDSDYKDSYGNYYPAISKNNSFNADNPYSIIYIGTHTRIGTTVKTGDRQARPLCTLTSNLWTTFDIVQNYQLPSYDPSPNSKEQTQVKAYSKAMCDRLKPWSKRFLELEITQSYSLRRGGNVNGASYGIPSEIRAQSMGHSRLLNETTYLESMTSEQQRKILMSQVNPISLDHALRLINELDFADKKDKAIKLIELIYQIKKLD